jgi:type VI secretion system secreted protein VgrG
MVDRTSPLAVITPLGHDVLQLVAFQGTEGVSQLFRFQLELVAGNDARVPFEALLGQPVGVRIELDGAPPRFFSGICSRFAQGARDGQRTSYRMELVPSFWLLTRGLSLRAFLDRAVPELVADLFDGRPVNVELAGAYPRREFLAQYRESDFEFASRLLEEEGIFYFFTHSEEGHELVLADSPESHPTLPAVQFDPKAASGTVFSWEKVQELAPGTVALRDHDYRLPEPFVEGRATIQPAAAVGGVEHVLALPAASGLEVYDFPGAYAQRFDGVDEAARAATIRMQALAAASLYVQGASTVPGLVAGHRFELTRHFDADGSYVLTQVSHSARMVDLRAGRVSYTNTFTCIPDSVPYRPLRTTPRPVASGLHTATVVEAPVDALGRYKVHFHWDVQGESSSWLRVAQQSLGGSMFWLPEVGDEVLVAFEHGDIDRPYVLGRVFNANDPPPDDREEEPG